MTKKKTSKQSLNEEIPVSKKTVHVQMPAASTPAITKAKPQRATTHNKKLPVKKVSRTVMLDVIAKTGGRFFTSTHIGKDEQPHTINGIRYKKQDNAFGYIEVYCSSAKEMRLINPQTLTDVSFGGIHYKAKK
jgi:hypothetical protein